MYWPDSYKVLKNENQFQLGEYEIIPIRYGDRYEIMRWRNDQIFHLRQDKPLTKRDQDYYFDRVLKKNFDKKNPNQLLFSFLQKKKLVGYGGLVHIDWGSNNAEISFVINSDKEKIHFRTYWLTFLELIENISFNKLNFQKIFVYSYEVRPNLYDVLSEANYIQEARLKSHKIINGFFFDVLIYSKFRL